MLYTVNIKNYTLTTVSEQFNFYFPTEKLSELNVTSFTFDDSTNKYKFYDSNNEVMNITITTELQEEINAIFTEFHNSFDAGAFDRAKERKLVELDIYYPLQKFYSPSVFFISSLGYKVKGDNYYKSYLTDLIELEEDYVITDYENNSHELTLEQIKTVRKELIKNQKHIEEQRVQQVNAINTATNLTELNNVFLTYEMKNFS